MNATQMSFLVHFSILQIGDLYQKGTGTGSYYTEGIMTFSNWVFVFSIWGCTQFKYKLCV